MPKIEVNQTTLNYDTMGNGAVVMLSHSLASDRTIWNRQTDALVNAGFRVLRFDTRGHGQSAVPPGPYSMQDLEEDAVALLDGLGIEQAHFCGVSLGGMTGQRLAIRHPHRLLSLVLCDTVSQMGTAEFWDARIATVRAGGMRAVADETIKRWFTVAGRAGLRPEADRIRDIVLSTPVEGYCACCAAIRDMDLREAVASISVPTLIIRGEHDAATPMEAAVSMRDSIAGSVLHVLPNAAHLAHIEQAETFNRLLIRCLTSISSRGNVRS